MNKSYDEVIARCESYTEALHALKKAKECAEKFPEYPEHLAMIHEMNELIDGLRDRLYSISKTSDKGFITRLHQLDSILGAGNGKA